MIKRSLIAISVIFISTFQIYYIMNAGMLPPCILFPLIGVLVVGWILVILGIMSQRDI